ncbi:MAG: nitrilase family protein [Bryobacterales bacterium]|nr:nitrilase family protein [Bryobacterales bacterium]
MKKIRVGSAQFEARDGGKEYNLVVIADLARKAKDEGADLVCFHECSISGYTYLENLTREELANVAEAVPEGPSIQRLIEIAADLGISIGAGLVEREGSHLYNTFVVVAPDGFVAKHRKIHAFVNDALTCGNAYTVFNHLGCHIGILTCYDNNLPENARITALMGADIILAPHVTGCLPSPMPGRGTVAPEIWRNRDLDPVRCRQEFDGPKGRGWWMRWLPARAWENGVYIVFANPIGEEGGTIKPGGSMILDPFGEVLVECRRLGDDVVVATLDPEKRKLASGPNYIRARRPDLYGKLTEPNLALSPSGRPDVWWKKNRDRKSDE